MLFKTMLRAGVSTAAIVAATAAQAQEAVILDEVSVTATREERPTKDVPQSIDVIGRERIESNPMMNVKDAVSGTPGVLIDSRNGGYDARLVLRGAGLKARYGIREIMLLRDGVPMTDPDSFTRLDFIDTQDIEQIEIVKGPGSIYATGSAGGTVQILSKPVFEQGNRLKLGIGNFGTGNAHARVGGFITDNQALSISGSWRRSDNDWRRWNEFDTKQVGIKHGWLNEGGGVLESEINYSQADLQLPGSMDAAMFQRFKRTGEQTDTNSPWKHSGRYSKIWFGNIRYEQEFGDFTFKPRVYATQWEHYHPVTGFINDSDGNYVFGTDIEGAYKHDLAGMASTLVGGVTLRQDISKDSKKYTYRDRRSRLAFPPFGPPFMQIVETLSDAKGDLAEVSDTTNTVYGVFAQESVQLTDKLLLDVGFRLDRSVFDIETNELIGFDWANTRYIGGAGRSSTDTAFNLFSPKAGLSYALTPKLSVYGSAAQAGQVPSTGEIESNPGLDSAKSTNFEIGLKARYDRFRLDAAAYFNPVENEIVSQRQSGQTVYVNAGETRKKGFEISASYLALPGLQVGGSYAYSRYKFEEFSEVVFGPGGGTNVSRNGNQLPFVPRHQYALFASYEHENGLRFRVQTESWGEYYTDNANTEKYGGYDFVTDVMLGYEIGQHMFAFNVENVFDKRYASEVSKDVSGGTDFYAGAPRTFMASYRLQF